MKTFCCFQDKTWIKMPKQTIFLATPVFFGFITENFWWDFLCNNWQSIFDVVERLCFLFPKFFWPTVRNKCSSDWEKTFQIWGWRLRIYLTFEASRRIHSNSKRSKQFLVTKCWMFLINKLIRTIRIQIGKSYWDLETCRKS